MCGGVPTQSSTDSNIAGISQFQPGASLMNGALISLIVVLAVLAGCPETATETTVDVAQAREGEAQDVKEARQDAKDAVDDSLLDQFE
jgi:hypothetical protein